MSHTRWWFWRPIAAAAAVAAALAAGATALAQRSGDTWWTGYGNGPDNSRYFASRQIDRSNVDRLQVAWTYPFGETGTRRLIYDVSMADASKGWAVGQLGTVLRTEDGGHTWTYQENEKAGEGTHLHGVHAIDANTAWAVGDLTDALSCSASTRIITAPSLRS